MAGKKVLKNSLAVTTAGVAIPFPLTASFISPVTNIEWGDSVSYEIIATTVDSIGTFSVQVSNDYTIVLNNEVANPGNWVTLTLSGTPTLAALDINIGIALRDIPYTAVRLAYTSTTAGTGTALIYVTSKQSGA
jgi:hypothetical protein